MWICSALWLEKGLLHTSHTCLDKLVDRLGVGLASVSEEPFGVDEAERFWAPLEVSGVGCSDELLPFELELANVLLVVVLVVVV